MPQSQSAPFYRDADYNSGSRVNAPQQSQRAPFYSDADYGSVRQISLGQSKEAVSLPMQSATAPLYRDADYSSTLAAAMPPRLDTARPSKYSKPLTIPAAPQSQDAPSYRNADYGTSNHFYAPQESSSAPFYANIEWESPGQPLEDFDMMVQSTSAPLHHDADFGAYPNSLEPRHLGDTDLSVPSIRSTPSPKPDNNRAPSYRTYDSFTHTYMDADVARETSRLSKTPRMPSLQSNDFGEQYIAGEMSSEVFWRTMCMDVVESEEMKKHRRCTPQDSHRFWEWLDWIFQLSKPEGIPRLHWHLNTHLQNKRMIKTKMGYIELASNDVRMGDRIGIFAGEAYPYVLRKTANDTKENVFNLVSPSYIHGPMDGRFACVEGMK